VLLKQTGVNDCLSSATAGLPESSILKVKSVKATQYLVSLAQADSGALQPEDVGLCRRGSRI